MINKQLKPKNMTFLESLKLVWLIQFLIGSAVVLFNFKDIEESAAEHNLPDIVMRIALFLAVVFTSWFFIGWTVWEYVSDRLFMLKIRFKVQVLWPLEKKSRKLKAWYYWQIRKQLK